QTPGLISDRVVAAPDGSAFVQLTERGLRPDPAFLWHAPWRTHVVIGRAKEAAFSADASLLATLDRRRCGVVVQDAHTGVEQHVLRNGTSCPPSFLLGTSGSLLAAKSPDGTVAVWDAASGLLVRTIAVGISAPLRFGLNDRYLVTAGQYGSAHVWDVTLGTEVATLL